MPNGSPFRVCLVCLGNICRSPMAEAVLRANLRSAGLNGAVVVDSAGTGDWHVGHGADARARTALLARGYPAEHTARQFSARWFAERDLVLAMDTANLRELRSLAPDPEAAERVRLLRSYDPNASGDLDVPDPYYGGADGFDLVLDQLERACAGLVDELRRTVSTG
jgi:protein-tyrosine phosphatase